MLRPVDPWYRGRSSSADLAAHTRSGQQAPNLLLTTVHSLLLRGADHVLGAFDPSVAHCAAVPPGDPMPAFCAFCRAHCDALMPLVSTGLVQTNEPQRCTVLLPAFATAGGQRKVESTAGWCHVFSIYP